MNSQYISKYQTLEKFSNSGSGSETDSIKCYECVGEWPTRNCSPIYKEEECVNGTFADYQSCTTRCGTEFNRPDGETGEIPVEVAEEAAEETTVVTDAILQDRINAAINEKMKQNKGEYTSTHAYRQIELAYRTYAMSLPYDIPRTFTLSTLLLITAILLVCNIVLTIYGAKAIGLCAGRSITMSISIALFIILSWIGNFLPYYGNFASMISMIITVVLTIVAGSLCK